MTKSIEIRDRLCSDRNGSRIGELFGLFAVGDWALRYYSPAKKCKLDSAWVGPYLVVSLAGWAVGIQLRPELPIIHVHCQDLKKISRPNSLVSWIDVAHPVGGPTLPVLGASTMGRTTPGSPSISVLPPGGGEGVVMSEIDSVKSTQVQPESPTCRRGGLQNGCFVHYSGFSSGVVSTGSSTSGYFHTPVGCGPIRLTTIAHAFNYRMALLRAGVKSAAHVGRSHRVEGRILEDAADLWGHH